MKVALIAAIALSTAGCKVFVGSNTDSTSQNKNLLEKLRNFFAHNGDEPEPTRCSATEVTDTPSNQSTVVNTGSKQKDPNQRAFRVGEGTTLRFRGKEYFLEQLLGAGGINAVYRATTTNVKNEQETVAVKIPFSFRPESAAPQNLAEIIIKRHNMANRGCRNSCRALNLLPIAASFMKATGPLGNDLGEVPAIVMPLADFTLFDIAERFRLGPQPPHDALLRIGALIQLLENLINASAYRYQRFYLAHNDIKAENIVVQNGKVLLADFDTIEAVEVSHSEKPQPTWETLPYSVGHAAPERHEQKLTRQSDYFSIANTILHLAFGKVAQALGDAEAFKNKGRAKLLAESANPKIWGSVLNKVRTTSTAVRRQIETAEKHSNGRKEAVLERYDELMKQIFSFLQHNPEDRILTGLNTGPLTKMSLESLLREPLQGDLNCSLSTKASEINPTGETVPNDGVAPLESAE